EKPEEDRLNDLLSLVKDIYQHNLLTSQGRETLNYLQTQRRLTPQLIDRFSLGCSISNKQLTSLLFSVQEFSTNLSRTNLVQINDNNQVYDYFAAQQLILPLTNKNGKIVAFASRKITVGSSESKYNYLPNYQTYQKSALLYNYSTVHSDRAEDCYLVEGFFDVISLTGLGVENCLALLGTNCSTKQIHLLHRLKKRVILFLDGDRAGREATINIILALLENEIDCEVISHPYQVDPDEICCHHERETVLNILQTRQNPYLFILDYHFRQ
ncbi:4753_t:CDS:1, partial [Racocetra fulgida]